MSFEIFTEDITSVWLGEDGPITSKAKNDILSVAEMNFASTRNS